VIEEVGKYCWQPEIKATDISTITVNINRVLDGENYSNVATASSRGYGVYLQLSRKINFRPAK